MVSFDPEDRIRIDEVLVTRSAINVFGQEMLNWSCAIDGAISVDGEQVLLSMRSGGGGDAGYSVVFDGSLQDGNRLVLEITERLWSNSARRCRLLYQLNKDGAISFVGNLPSK